MSSKGRQPPVFWFTQRRRNYLYEISRIGTEFDAVFLHEQYMKLDKIVCVTCCQLIHD